MTKTVTLKDALKSAAVRMNLSTQSQEPQTPPRGSTPGGSRKPTVPQPQGPLTHSTPNTSTDTEVEGEGNTPPVNLTGNHGAQVHTSTPVQTGAGGQDTGSLTDHARMSMEAQSRARK